MQALLQLLDQRKCRNKLCMGRALLLHDMEPRSPSATSQEDLYTCSVIRRNATALTPDRQLEVELNRGALELAPEGVKHCDVNLGAVECPIRLI